MHPSTIESQNDPLYRSIRNYTLQNALRFGKGDPRAIIGKVMHDHPEMRSRAREVMEWIRQTCDGVSTRSPDEWEEELRAHAPELLERREGRREDGLPDLTDVRGGVVMRFAPGPSGPLHIGHSRAAVLNDEFVKRYGGKYILRLEDTNPMKIMPEAYDMIPEDMDWLGTTVHEVVRQSDRFGIYIHHAKRIIEAGGGYVCSCPVEEWRSLKELNRPCPHRGLDVEANLAQWERMLDGSLQEGEASLVVKTDLDHPNPAVRDFVAMRINDYPHPLTGSSFRVYPLYNYSVVIDDHLMGMTHVLRGKDHLNNTYKQKYVYEHLGWDQPAFFHYGWVSIPDTLLKTSSIKEGIRNREYTGWDDVRLGTFRALERRGFDPEAIRRYWIGVGMKEVDITFSWKNLIAHNKEIIDPVSPRFFFVSDPVHMTVTNAVELEGRAPFFPDRPEEGHRDVRLVSDGMGIRIVITAEDAAELQEGALVRLKDLGNVRILKIGPKGVAAAYIDNDVSIIRQGARNIHWCPKGGVPTTVFMDDGTTVSGLTEPGIMASPSPRVQFERFGFVRIERTGDSLNAFFTHK